MKPSISTWSLLAITLIIASCGESKSSGETNSNNTNSRSTINNEQSSQESEQAASLEDMLDYNEGYEAIRGKLPQFDLNQDLSNKSLSDLRILRETISARYGFLFMDSDLRNHFNNTHWYSAIMEARWYGDCEYSGLQKAPEMEFTAEEIDFVERVKAMESALKGKNFVIRNGLKYPNISNIINANHFGELPEKLLDGLDRNGMAIVPNNNIQLFHVYEKNDYSQTPNFVSTDTYLQLFHMHFSFMLRGLEEEYFVPMLKEMMLGFGAHSRQLSSKITPSDQLDALEYNSAFYSIPLTILGEKNVQIPLKYQDQVKSELVKIENAQFGPSDLIPAFKIIDFPYDLFKPRGHYTRNDTLKRYFKAMQWLQLAPYCLKEPADFNRAILAAFVLNTGKGKSGKSLKSLYEAILKPTSFLIGQPDNLSLLDICDILDSKKINTIDQLFNEETINLVQVELENLKGKNVIKPKIQNSCPDKINFMPARFVLDNEIIQTMTDIEKRPFPKGLDVLAGFGSEGAEKVLLADGTEAKQWDEFLPNLKKMKAKYKNYEDWDETVYAKWIKGLTTMLRPDENYPSFMKLPAWNKKNLNTALASWAELKHDAILYAEQPFAAECGGGADCEPPPDPYVVGYVEPNVNYWQEALELLELTESLLMRHDLYSNQLKSRQSQLRELCAFFLSVSKKELRNESLTEQEYRTIEVIGSSIENITLSIVEAEQWDLISGPDKEVAVVADVYTHNVGPKAGIFHVAVGYVNDLFVVVEINGYLYLTKGATFSYYEFPRPLNAPRLTDEDWQKMLKDKKIYPAPEWMNDLIIILDESIQPEAMAYAYSSGC